MPSDAANELARGIPETDFVGIGRRFMRIDERVAVRYPCCDTTVVDTRRACIRPRAGAQVNSTNRSSMRSPALSSGLGSLVK